MKGPHGGFSLAKDSKIITLYDIVVAIDGEDTFNNCIMHDESCHSVNKSKKSCPIHDDYAKLRSDLIRLFKRKTIYDLVVKSKNSDIITI